MLVLSRRLGQRIFIGENIVITVLSIKGGHVELGIDAPRSVVLSREEVYQGEKMEQEHAPHRKAA